MNDFAICFILVIICGCGLYELSERNNNNLRPSKAKFCKIESINPKEKCVYER